MPREADGQHALSGLRVCVTGGAGFIGSHLCDALVGHGADVCVIDDLSAGLEANLAAVRARIRLVRGSILDAGALADAVAGAHVVFHLAAIASVPRSVREPALYVEVNAMGTQRVLEAARCAGARRVVYSASSSAYGDQPGLPRRETMPPDPSSPYAAAKCAGEQLARAYAACYELDTVSLRYFNIFGPRQRPDSPYAAVIPVFTRSMLAGERFTIFGDGAQTRDFTHVANAVDANVLAAARPAPLAGAIVNVACGHSISVRELVERMAELLGVDAAYDLAPPRPGEVQHSLADITLARELLGYEPVTGFDEGLATTLASYR